MPIRNISVREVLAISPVRLGSYHDYICGVGACVKYRLAQTQAEYDEALSLALEETDIQFPVANPLYRLSVEAASAGDEAFCASLLAVYEDADFTHNTDYLTIVNILREVASE